MGKATKTNEGPKEEAQAYEPPAIEFIETLEILAVACDDATAKANPIDCPLGPANS